MNPPLKTTLAVSSNEPVSVAEVKLHCRIDHDDEDTLLLSLISTARQHIEEVTGRALVEKLVQWRFDTWNDVLACRLSPVPFVNLSSFSYLDVADVDRDVPAPVYRVITSDRGARVVLRANQVWPSLVSDEAYPIQLTFKASPGTSSGSPSIPTVPAPLRSAMLLIIGDLYENRESQVVGTIVTKNETAAMLIRPFKVYG